MIVEVKIGLVMPFVWLLVIDSLVHDLEQSRSLSKREPIEKRTLNSDGTSNCLN
jgi:hypothetical protein